MSFIHDPEFHDILESHEDTTIVIEASNGKVGAITIHPERYLTVEIGESVEQVSDPSQAKRRNDLRDRIMRLSDALITNVMTIYNG
jgi:hypothetical protein